MKTNKIYKLSSKHKETIEILGNELKIKLKPIRNYWLKLSVRERMLILGGGVLISLTCLVLIINTLFNSLANLSSQLQIDKKNEQIALAIQKQYSRLNQSAKPSFTSVQVEKIKKDATEILGNNNSDITLDEDTLRINISSVKFSSSLLFLDQLRKSYGLFPVTLNINRLPQAGLISLSATFNLEEKS